MTLQATSIMGLLFAVAVYGSDDRSKLSGTWQAESAGARNAETWVIEEKPDAVHMSHAQGDEKPVESECNSMGRECELKEAGKQMKVSFWFNGPKLVQLETRGSEVVRRRFSLAADGNTLEVETTRIVPSGEPQTVRFKRVETSAAQR